MDKTTTAIAAITVIVLAGIIGVAINGQRNYKPSSQCVEHSQSLTMHIHPTLSIEVNGAPVAIPANIGVSASCMKALHTHDETGKIHVEFPEDHDLVLGDFFANWGEVLTKDQLMEHKLDDKHTLTMTVDGQPSTEFEKLVLKDGQKIMLKYETKK